MELEEQVNRSLIHGEAFAETLIHEEKRKYDPVKRKEYYERTKKLKGRKKGSTVTTVDKKTGKTRNESDPIGDTLKTLGKPLSWIKKKASEGIKDAKLTLEVIQLESAGRDVQKYMDSTNNPLEKAKAAATLAKIIFEIKKREREIAKSSV